MLLAFLWCFHFFRFVVFHDLLRLYLRLRRHTDVCVFVIVVVVIRFVRTSLLRYFPRRSHHHSCQYSSQLGRIVWFLVDEWSLEFDCVCLANAIAFIRLGVRECDENCATKCNSQEANKTYLLFTGNRYMSMVWRHQKHNIFFNTFSSHLNSRRWNDGWRMDRCDLNSHIKFSISLSISDSVRGPENLAAATICIFVCMEKLSSLLALKLWSESVLHKNQ